MPRLTGQAAILIFGRLLNMAAASATLMVLARIMPDLEQYGAICQLIMLYMVFSQIFSAGQPQSIYYFMPRFEGGERRGFLTQSVVLLMGSGLLLGVVLFFGADFVGHLLKSVLLPSLLKIFAIYPFFMLPTTIIESVMLHHNRPLESVIYQAAARLGMFVSLVIPVMMGATLNTVIWAWVGMALVMWTMALALMFSTVRGLPLSWRPEMFREEVNFSLPLILSTLLMIAGVYLDRFLISSLYGAALFGIYNNATLIIPSLGMVANAGSAVLMSELSKRTLAGDFHNFVIIWNSAMMKAGIVLFATMGFLVFWGPETMSILFSDRFAGSAKVFAIYVWIIPAQMFILQSLFVAMNATRMQLLIPSVGLVAEVLCIYLGQRLFGFYGIAIGAVLARYIGVLFGSYIFVTKVTNLGWKRFMPWSRLAIALIIALIAGAGSRLIGFIHMHDVPSFMIYAVGLLTFGVLYALGLLLVRLLNFIIPSHYLPARWYPRVEV